MRKIHPTNPKHSDRRCESAVASSRGSRPRNVISCSPSAANGASRGRNDAYFQDFESLVGSELRRRRKLMNSSGYLRILSKITNRNHYSIETTLTTSRNVRSQRYTAEQATPTQPKSIAAVIEARATTRLVSRYKVRPLLSRLFCCVYLTAVVTRPLVRVASIQ